MIPSTALGVGGKKDKEFLPNRGLPLQLRPHCPGSLNSPGCLSEGEGESDTQG